MEIINLGSDEENKEVNICAILDGEVKKKLIELLYEYMDVFSWSYQDIPGMDTYIVVHKLPLREDCPPVKQKLIRTHLDMDIKIKEEV